MKIDKFADEGRLLSMEAKELFLDLWDDPLLLSKVFFHEYNDTLTNKLFYQLYCTINQSIKKDTYDDYKSLFDIFLKCDADFKLDKNELKATFYDINYFIEEMKILKNSKKFNI